MMTDYEKITLVITFISVLVSIVAVIVAVSSNGKAKEANNLSKEANIISKETVTKAEGANIIALEANSVAKKSNEISFQAKNLSEGDIELTINQMITQTKKEMREISLIIAAVSCKDINTRSPEEKTLLELYKAIHDAAFEDNLNAYDEACAKYLDGKVDKERFKRMYKTQIRQLVEDKENEEQYNHNKSRYQATLKVFKEWEHLETDR